MICTGLREFELSTLSGTHLCGLCGKINVVVRAAVVIWKFSAPLCDYHRTRKKRLFVLTFRLLKSIHSDKIFANAQRNQMIWKSFSCAEIQPVTHAGSRFGTDKRVEQNLILNKKITLSWESQTRWNRSRGEDARKTEKYWEDSVAFFSATPYVNANQFFQDLASPCWLEPPDVILTNEFTKACAGLVSHITGVVWNLGTVRFGETPGGSPISCLYCLCEVWDLETFCGSQISWMDEERSARFGNIPTSYGAPIFWTGRWGNAFSKLTWPNLTPHGNWVIRHTGRREKILRGYMLHGARKLRTSVQYKALKTVVRLNRKWICK